MSVSATGELISVVVPAYNASKYIARTLNSVCNQTHRELEIIVVDDGSTDNTAALVEAAMVADNRIQVLRAEHGGVSRARNLGIAKARGVLIAPIDADDLWTHDKLARQLAVLRKSGPETGVVYSWAAGIDDDENIVLPVWNDSHAEGDVLHEIIQSGILSCGSTPLIRKEFVTLAGGYDEELHLAEDWKFYTALAGVCRFAVIPECLTGYRIRSDSSSVNLAPMETALERFTQWVTTKWPGVPPEVLAERAFTISTYLAFMATRGGQYARVPRYLLRAIVAKPRAIFSLTFWQFALLPFAHAAGLRRYHWAFWQKPQKFVE